MQTHVVQSPEFGEVKRKLGYKVVRVGDIQYTLHKLPLPHTNYFIGYAPKVDPLKIDWKALEQSAKENNVIAINFDIPNVVRNTPEGDKATEILKKHGTRSVKDTFAPGNIFIDLTKSEDELLAEMNKNRRYAVRKAQKSGVKVRYGETQKDVDDFYELLKAGAKRRKYFIRSKDYYQTVWEIMHPKKQAHILNAYLDDKVLATWFLFAYDGVLYYPYGASTIEDKKIQASSLVGWEAIKLGKELGCRTFDMWGAAVDPSDKDDFYYGFTVFKSRFGGHHAVFIESYDFVLNRPIYELYRAAEFARWKLLKLLK